LRATEKAFRIFNTHVFQTSRKDICGGGHSLFGSLIHRGDALVGVLALVDCAQTFFD
jgi:hypothetical protein